MASDLLSIAKSGANAARIALDVTAQNIANASSEGYVRRSVSLQEVAASGGLGRTGDVSLSGVRLDSVVRNADAFRQSEVRRTGADAARADAEVAGLENIEAAVEHADVYSGIVRFEASLQRLASDPVDTSLRASVIEEARTMARTFNLASGALDAARDSLQFEASDGVSQVNVLTGELARVNLRLARAADASSDQTALLDQRDLLLQKLSGYVGTSVTIAADQTVEVRLGSAAGLPMVSGGASATMAMTSNANGPIAFTLDGNPAVPLTGSLAGKGQALTKLAQVRGDLDVIAGNVISIVNISQANGASLSLPYSPPLFAGSDAASMALNPYGAADIGTAPLNSPPGSRDPGNLIELRQNLAAADPAGKLDALLFDISGTVAGRSVTRDALQSIAGTARIALEAQAGVDLDHEAVNLIRFQQAFQASGRVMQVASDIFDTLLGIR